MKHKKGTLFKTNNLAWATVPDTNKVFDNGEIAKNIIGIFIRLDLFNNNFYILFLKGSIISVSSDELDKI